MIGLVEFSYGYFAIVTVGFVSLLGIAVYLGEKED